MSTPNFKNNNASKIYAVELEQEWDYSDLVTNIQNALKNYTPQDDTDNSRNYPAVCVAKKTIERGKWFIEVKAMIRGGYYSGANLDWEVEVEDKNEYEIFDWGEAETPNYINSIVEKQIAKLEKVYKSLSTPLICRGIFSNGEAFYEGANI